MMFTCVLCCRRHLASEGGSTGTYCSAIYSAPICEPAIAYRWNAGLLRHAPSGTHLGTRFGLQIILHGEKGSVGPILLCETVSANSQMIIGHMQ